MQAKDAALRRVGRNIANFQKVESALRLLLPTLSAGGTIKEIEAQIEESRKRIKKHGLGDLSEALHRAVFKEAEELAPPEVLTEPVFSFSMRIEGTKQFVKTFKSRWRKLVVQRNKLVHSQLLNYNFENTDDCARLSAMLDIQNTEICALLEEVVRLNTNRAQVAAALIERLQDPAAFLPSGGAQDDA